MYGFITKLSCLTEDERSILDGTKAQKQKANKELDEVAADPSRLSGQFSPFPAHDRGDRYGR